MSQSGSGLAVVLRTACSDEFNTLCLDVKHRSEDDGHHFGWLKLT